jgi:hypothetical protein
LHSLWRANLQDALTGSYVESGLNASPGSSGSSIQVDVDRGDVRINDSPTSVAGDTLSFDAVATADEFRADVIYVTTSGGLAVEKGNSATPQPTIDDDDPYPTGTPQPARRLFAPSPPDGSSINGLPIHVVLVADTTSDSNDLALEDLVDYRISPPLPGDHTHPEFALNRRTLRLTPGTNQYVKLAQVSKGQVATTGIRTVVGAANGRGTSTVRRLDVEIAIASSTFDVEALAYGSRSSATDLVLTRESASAAGTAEDRFHLYAFVPSETDPYIIQTHTDGSSNDQFGEYQRVENLSSNDLVGDVVWDTGGSTGGPGDETQVPKAPDAVRSDVEGSSDVAALTSDDAPQAGMVAVSTGIGDTQWAERVPKQGEWVPLGTYQFQQYEYSRTGDTFNDVLSTGNHAPIIPYSPLQLSNYSDVGVSLTAQLKTSNQGNSARARLDKNLIGDQIPGTGIAHDGEDFQTKTSAGNSGGGIEIYSAAEQVGRVFLQMKCEGSNNTATLQMPSATVWGRTK